MPAMRNERHSNLARKAVANWQKGSQANRVDRSVKIPWALGGPATRSSVVITTSFISWAAPKKIVNALQ
jgi:hypothetical protein